MRRVLTPSTPLLTYLVVQMRCLTMSVRGLTNPFPTTSEVNSKMKQHSLFLPHLAYSTWLLIWHMESSSELERRLFHSWLCQKLQVLHQQTCSVRLDVVDVEGELCSDERGWRRGLRGGVR